MSREMGVLYVAVYCKNCGFTDGRPNGDTDRCADCGRFASPNPDVCCVRHEVRSSPYPSGECPLCEQERSVRAQEQEMHERRADPNMHPTVDAPRR